MKKLFIAAMLLISAAASAQKLPSSGFDKIRIADGDKTIQADLKPMNNDPDMETDRYYYWASGNAIHSTQGGFSGRLLNGNYAEYYLNKNLRQQGFFKKGLKQGTWKDWSENGVLKDEFSWNKGIKAGKFSLYDEQGNLKETGHYKDNQLEGGVKTYENGQWHAVNYHQGLVVSTKKIPFWRKIYPFKRKNKTP